MTATLAPERVYAATALADIAISKPVPPACAKSSHAKIDGDIQPEYGKWCELIDGIPVEKEPMRISHGAVTRRIATLIDNHISNENLPFDVGVGASFRLGMSASNFRIPDLHITALARLDVDLNNEPGVWNGYPDIAIEVISPTDAYMDVIGKAQLYLRQGVSIALIVDARHRQVTVWQANGTVRILAESDTLDLDSVLPGFACRVAEIFAPLDRIAAFAHANATRSE